MKTFKLVYIFEHFKICYAEIEAETLKKAKHILRKKVKGKVAHMKEEL